MTSSTSQGPAASAELPVHLTRFIGRDRELDELARLIQSTRLLTLTGAGGSGKTRLAHETAVRAAPTFSRVVWIDLASLSDTQLLPQQFAAALRVPERGGASPIAALIEAIGTERL